MVRSGKRPDPQLGFRIRPQPATAFPSVVIRLGPRLCLEDDVETTIKTLRFWLGEVSDALNAANNIAKRGGVDFDTPGRAAVRSDGPKSRPKAGRSGRLAMPVNPITPRQDVLQLDMAL